MIVSFKCLNCNKEFSLKLDKPVSETDCECGLKAKRKFVNILLSQSDQNVDYATRTMMYSSMPSSSDKKVY